jgi:cytochrome-b5 reductase
LFVQLTLAEKEEITHDVRRFRFTLPSPSHVLGLPVGKHITLSYNDNEGKLVSRTYTPVTSDDEVGYVDFVLKVYFPNERFPNGGKMSQYLNNLKIGETMDAQGPKGNMTYLGKGTFELRHGRENKELRSAKHVGMIAGGTGVTPMYQLVKAALKDTSDDTVFSLLFANQTEADILLRKELDDLASTSDRFNVWYTVDKAPDDWAFSEGFISKEMMQDHLPPRGPGNMILVCGPPPMIKFACLPSFEQLGMTEEMVYIEGNRSTMAIFQEHRRASKG